MGRVREIARLRRWVRVGAPDPTLTGVSGMAAVTELVERLGMVRRLDAAIGPIKTRDRGHTGGELLIGVAAAQLLASVAGLSSTTAAGLARRITEGQWRAVETGIGDIYAATRTGGPRTLAVVGRSCSCPR